MNRRGALARLGLLGQLVIAPAGMATAFPGDKVNSSPRRPALTVHDAEVDPRAGVANVLLEWDGPVTATVYILLQTVNGDDLRHSRNALSGIHFAPLEIYEVFRIGDEPKRTVPIKLLGAMDPGQWFSLWANMDGAGFEANQAAGRIQATPRGVSEPYEGRRAQIRSPRRGRLTFAPDLQAEVPHWPDRFRHGRVQEANNELGYYSPSSFHFAGSDLVLEARCERVEADMNGKPVVFGYRSSVVTTFGVFSQQYGYWEAECMTPSARGSWGAFWLLPDGATWWPPEIDVFEHPRNGKILSGYSTATQHWQDELGRKKSYGQALIPVAGALIHDFDGTTQFHRYGVDWREDTIGWFIDDIEVFRMETTFHEPAYLVLDVAVGGWAGSPDFSIGSTDMVVRSVKVFE